MLPWGVSGLMMSTTVPPAAAEENVSASEQAGRPELDSSLFSDLMAVGGASQKIDSPGNCRCKVHCVQYLLWMP